jgi:hypothetical protein
MKLLHTFLLGLICLPLATALASDVVPRPYEVERYSAAWQKNPFLRVTKVSLQTREVWAADWMLNGMAEFDGKTFVTLVNSRTGEKRRLTSNDSPGAEMRLVRAHFSRTSSEAFVEVQKGGETAILKYSGSKP